MNTSEDEMEIMEAVVEDLELLVQLRIAAMKPSLIAVGRFDPERARERFAETFTPKDTSIILVSGEVVGFYVVLENQNHLELDHLYIHPDAQGAGVGTCVIVHIKNMAAAKAMPIKLGALKESPANQFYIDHGFVKTHEEDWDNYYVWEKKN